MLSRYKRLGAAFLIGLTLLFTVQRANAFWDEFGTFAPAIAAGAVGAAGVTGTICTATAGIACFTPVGWLAIGVAITASFLLVGDSQGNKVAVVVSTRSTTDDPNPDIATAAPALPPAGTYYGLRLSGTVYPYAYLKSANTLAPSSPSVNTLAQTFMDRTVAQAKVAGYDMAVCDGTAGCPRTEEYAGDTWCAGNGGFPCFRILVRYGSAVPGAKYTIASGPMPSDWSMHALTNGDTTTAPQAWLYVPIAVISGAFDCPAQSQYDYGLSSCLTAQPSTLVADKFCRISWAPNGCPVKNPFDPDCAGVSITTSCGSPTAPPSVTVVDPETGKTVTTTRPVLPGQGVPGAVEVVERTPNPEQGTTTEKRTKTSPPTVPGGAPTSAGTAQVVYPGTGTGTSTTPVGSVAVSNWPDTVNVKGEVTCTNCTTTAPTFPDKMKIDAEGHSANDLPDGEAEAQALAGKDFMSEIKDKVNPFSGSFIPSHNAACPAFHLQFNAWLFNVNYQDNSMCNFLENPTYKTGIQTIVKIMLLIAAILIVMGA